MATNFVSYANSEVLMQAIADKFKEVNGAYVYKGSIAFASLPATLTKNMVGYVYNMNADFTTDARFVEGAGKKYPAGTNVSIIDVSDYSAVTPVGSENPKTEGWYELDGSTYVLTTDETVDNSKTYYEFVEAFMFDTLGNFVDVDAIEAEIKAVSDMICGEFDDATAYSTGDVVVYEGKLYKFKADHVAGAWDATEVDETTVIALIEAAEPESLTTAQVNALLALLA